MSVRYTDLLMCKNICCVSVLNYQTDLNFFISIFQFLFSLRKKKDFHAYSFSAFVWEVDKALRIHEKNA